MEAIQHPDKRLNIPTADAQEFVADEHQSVPRVVFERDETLDPQLVWRGKFDHDVSELAVDAPPIYIQEKIDPRVLVENLRETAAAGASEPELTLFDGFDGLDELDSVDFYRHHANWANRMILGDSLQVMASLAERESLRGKVQMIYIDPPYGIKFGSNWQASARKRDVKDGKVEDAAREAEQIKAFRDTWELGIHSYLSYLRDRLVVARDLLTESGSVFVQIGDENVHLVRSLLDEVFGSENFFAQINFKSMGSLGQSGLAKTYDYIIWYSKDVRVSKFHPLYTKQVFDGDPEYRYRDAPDEPTGYEVLSATQPRPPGHDGVFRRSTLSSSGYTASCTFPFTVGGRTFWPYNGKSWRTNADGMERLRLAQRVFVLGNSPYLKRYANDFNVIQLDNSWSDAPAASARLYVVETATKFIERCMLMCTDPGDLVLDPTCGSGTTSYVAEQWGRRWITIDTSRVALALARQRLMGAKYPYYLLADSPDGRRKEQVLTNTALPPAATSSDIRQGFVYERVQHITLKSIANNPDIKEGMTRAEIDAAIKRHADYETLYDRPYEDTSKVRVSGPFTVESLSPHRSLSFQAHETSEPDSEVSAARSSQSVPFEQTVLDNLARAGIQNGRRAERIEFSAVERHPGLHIQAIGERRETKPSTDLAPTNQGESPTRVAVAVGPQYGTVDGTFIKSAAREAIAGGVDLLCVLAFAFDPQATGVTEADSVSVEVSSAGFAQVAGERSMGRIKVLLVRMNVDLLMGAALKKTGAGNLFTVFGEPDIEVSEHADGGLVVELRGVDVYDPTTSEVRSDSTDRIALWMIDTNYNEESFFVRHCYFTGGGDPYKRLKTALKADIDADAWATLYSTTSRPFDKPATGKIAVKVINDYGDEVMKVFEVAYANLHADTDGYPHAQIPKD